MAVIDQASQLRALVSRSLPTCPTAALPATVRPEVQRATVIAITSGKGGVGKSNISVNLAVHLAAAGKDVILLDADLGLANADVLCNLDLHHNLSHVIARKKVLHEVLSAAPGGFRLIAGASGLAKMADLSDFDRQHLLDSMTELEQESDVMLIDTGAGISANVLAFTRAADHVLVVTTPEPTAITDAYATIKVISRDGADRRISLLVNQAQSAGEARLVYDRIAKVARQFLQLSILDAGFVYSDDAVPAAVRKRTPFSILTPRCLASQCIAHLAVRLEQGVAGKVEPTGFFTRMGRWLRK
jgi:flagellar biosynthesis protein FlhG